LEKEVKDLSEIYAYRTRFKFLEVMGEPLSRLRLAAEKEHPYFFNALDNYQDSLLDDKENVLEAVKKFMNGAQKEIFESVLNYLEGNNANFTYIDQSAIGRLTLVKESAAPYKGNIMQEAKAALEEVKTEVLTKINSEREIAADSVKQSMDRIKTFEDYNKLSAAQQIDILRPFETALNEIAGERYIGNIRTKANYASNETYQKQLAWMIQLANPIVPVEPGSKEPAKPRIVFVPRDTVKVQFKKPQLETPQDVEDYVEALKQQYLRIIKDDKRISL
jgi:hypothetical protein